MNTIHHLKCWPEFFDAVKRGSKTFEVRKNDRGYQRGDQLLLHKYSPTADQIGKHYLRADGARCDVEGADVVLLDVTYVLSGNGIEPGFVCLGTKLVHQ
jgi:hypothetical protein